MKEFVLKFKKIYKKSLVILLAICMLVQLLPLISAAEEIGAAITETFDSMPTGAAPNGWEIAPTDRTDAGVWVTKAPKTTIGGNAMRIEDNSSEFAKPTSAAKIFLPTADVELLFDYYLESVKGANAFAIASGGIETRQKRVNLGIFDNGDGTATLKYFDISQWKWIATPKTDLQKETWYSFRVVSKANANAADLYLNGEKLCSVWADKSIATVDRVVFHTNNKASIEDVFYIDNVKVIGPDPLFDSPAPFEDLFENANALSLYQTSGSVSVEGGEMLLLKGAYAERRINATKSGKFGFCVTLQSPTDLQFALMSGGKPGIYITADEDGTLCYRRDNKWIAFSAAGTVRANEQLTVAIDLPLDRNVNYARIYVNDNYVGMAIYTNSCATVEALRFESLGKVSIDNVWASASDGILQMPTRTEEAPAFYVPEVISSTPLFLANDTSPSIGAINPYTEDVILDSNRNSVGVDLGEKQTIHALRLYDSDNTVTSRANHFTLWYSDDNQNWNEIKGFQFNRIVEDGKCQVLFEFSGIEARYLKINTSKEDKTGSIRLSDLSTCIRAERRITRQWKMAGTPMQAQNDLSPITTPMAQVFVQSPITIKKGDSIGIWFGIHSFVEAIELCGNGLETLSADAFALYYSNDNTTYTKIENVILSKGNNTYRLTFENIKCGYLKLHMLTDADVSLLSLAEGLAAYSSQEVRTGHVMQSSNRGADGDFYTMPDGILVASYNGFVASVGSAGGGDASDASLNAFTSSDGGYTWSEGEAFLLKNKGSLNILNPTYIWLATGELGLIYCEKEETEICNIYMRRSSDNGLTWSNAQRITDAPQGYTILPSGHRVLRLSSGRILLPVGYSVTVNDVYGSDRAIGYVWYSDDEGITWHRSLDALTLPHAALEPSVAELTNGNILLSLRTREERVIYQSISTDGGLTWAQPIKTNIQSPSATNTVMSVPATKDIALFWNNDFSANGTDRRPLTVTISADGGMTYHNTRSLVDCDYPTPWPSVAFYGRSVFLMHGNETHVRVFDIATLYYTTSGKITVADLPLAATPNAIYDAESGWLTGVSGTMQYSLDMGKTWVFAGGTSVLLNVTDETASEIWVKDVGTTATAPSKIQIIKVEKQSPPKTDEAPSTESTQSTPKSENPILPIVCGAIAIGAALAATLIGVRYAKKKKRKTH